MPGVADRAAAVRPSWAERLQGDITEDDYALVERARLYHPAVRWWWGVRSQNGRNGATCYVCDQQVATWQPSYPMTRQAVDAILTHRAIEVEAAWRE